MNLRQKNYVNGIKLAQVESSDGVGCCQYRE
jgi:hypothetical protein